MPWGPQRALSRLRERSATMAHGIEAAGAVGCARGVGVSRGMTRASGQRFGHRGLRGVSSSASRLHPLRRAGRRCGARTSGGRGRTTSSGTELWRSVTMALSAMHVDSVGMYAPSRHGREEGYSRGAEARRDKHGVNGERRRPVASVDHAQGSLHPKFTMGFAICNRRAGRAGRATRKRRIRIGNLPIVHGSSLA